MTGPIEIDIDMVRNVARTLVDTYERLVGTPQVTVERGDRTATTLEFRTTMEKALDVHRQNREALIIQLGRLSQDLKGLGDVFQEVEEEFGWSLYYLECRAYEIQERRAAQEAGQSQVLPDPWAGARLGGPPPPGGVGPGATQAGEGEFH